MHSLLRYYSPIFLLIFFACQPPQKEGPRKIELLLLGHDSEHHNSEKYTPILAAALAKKGINISYTESVSDLNPQNLAYYDGLIIYANHDSIGKAEEAALLDFVKEGKGLIPIHCASFCFRNSDAYVSLVGAQFKEHGTGTFTAQIVKEDHSITQGLEPFETWDETYIHHEHNPNRTVLMERVEGDHREPWTWTRTYGKGRVFYTAYGHDERTWNHPGFHVLVERGIRWAVGEEVQQQWEKLAFEQAVYQVKSTVQNYEKREPYPQYQEPFSATASQAFIQVPPQFDLKLFASEPNVINPIAMTWDERGRLWVIETVDYPNEVKALQKGDDRIKICEDTDGDGQADQFTVFAEGLNIPTSLVLVNGGVIISQAPHFLFLKDTNGDDRADTKEIILNGWGVFDTHAGPSNLRYGPNNQIWGTVGYSGFEGSVGGKPMKFRQGFYQFKPDGSSLEVLTNTSNNTWGLGFSETFDVFGSTANNAHSWYMAIPNRYYEGVKGLRGRGSDKIAEYYAFHPITKNIRQVDVFGGFTAAAGHNLYTARDFPKEYWNRMAFICEPTGHLLAKGIIDKQGAGFVTKDDWNMMASADEWVSPVHAEVGPDGALWVLDWYNFIIQHNPTPSPERGGFQAANGKGNAHINPLRDRTHGRIYRVVYKNAKPKPRTSLDINDPKGLVKALKHDNMFWRTTAQRLLVERGKVDVVPELVQLIQNKKMDEIGINGGAIHALWTLQGLGAIDRNEENVHAVVARALSHPAAGVRKAAIQVLPREPWAERSLRRSGVLVDPDLHTRLAALLAIADLPSSKSLGKTLLGLSQDSVVYQDPWLSQALYVAAFQHQEGFLAAFEADEAAQQYFFKSNSSTRINGQLPELFTEDWKQMPVPPKGWGWEQAGLPDFDGVAWLRKKISLSASEANSDAVLHLGTIDDTDITYVNGVQVGATPRKPEAVRTYSIPKGVLKAGVNVIAVKIEDYGGRGGFYGTPADEIYLEVSDQQRGLAGEWKYQVEETYKGEITPVFSQPYDLACHFVRSETQQEYATPVEERKVASNSQQLRLSVIPLEMKYEQTELVVEAGREVEITFENPDFMQHNFLLINPGTTEEIGKLADALATQPDGMAKNYVPDSPNVLFASKLVDPKQTVSLRFTAPSTPGDYPFICTFPGHWRTMQGILKVVPAKVL